jgi:hypothetical protein
MPPGSFAIRSGTIDVIFHEPVATAGLGMEDRNELAEEVWNLIAGALEADSQVRA